MQQETQALPALGIRFFGWYFQPGPSVHSLPLSAALFQSILPRPQWPRASRPRLRPLSTAHCASTALVHNSSRPDPTNPLSNRTMTSAPKPFLCGPSSCPQFWNIANLVVLFFATVPMTAKHQRFYLTSMQFLVGKLPVPFTAGPSLRFDINSSAHRGKSSPFL